MIKYPWDLIWGPSTPGEYHLYQWTISAPDPLIEPNVTLTFLVAGISTNVKTADCNSNEVYYIVRQLRLTAEYKPYASACLKRVAKSPVEYIRQYFLGCVPRGAQSG